MRIAIFDDLPEGGAKRVVYEQVKGLSKYYEIFYYTNLLKSVFDIAQYTNKVRRYDLELPRYKGWRRPLTEIALWTDLSPAYGQIVNDIKREGIQLIIAHPSQITQAPLILGKGIPGIYYAEEWLRLVYENLEQQPIGGIAGAYEFVRRRLIKTYDYIFTRKADMVVCNSAYTKSCLEKAYRREDCRVIYPGVDLKVFRPGKSAKRYFLFVGERVDANGYDLLAQSIRQSPIKFKIKFVEYAERGFKYTDKEMCRIYQDAVATLCLSRGEPFGLAAIESMACGTPVIAVKEGGYLETVSVDSGLLIDRDNTQLMSAMKQLATDTILRDRLAISGRDRVRMLFTWKQHIQKLNQVIKELTYPPNSGLHANV